MSCNINHCNSCKSGYLLNNNFNCVKKLDNCMKQNLDIDDLQCLECDKDYYCIRGDTINCRKFDTRIDSIDFYYYYNYSHTSIQAIAQYDQTFVYPCSGKVKVIKKGDFLWEERFGDCG